MGVCIAQLESPAQLNNRDRACLLLHNFFPNLSKSGLSEFTHADIRDRDLLHRGLRNVCIALSWTPHNRMTVISFAFLGDEAAESR